MVWRQQSGYGLLLLIVVMLGGSVSAVQWVGAGRFLGSPLLDTHVEQLALMQSSQSLLSYATAYPYLYGPRGAGPGHLPCPDTDAFGGNLPSGLFENDGPDPPCGRQRVARGQLPRQVTLSGSRYAFSELASERLGYEVDGGVINNPINRVVNPATLIDMTSEAIVAATISTLSALPTEGKLRARSTVITPAALHQAARAGVSAWILSRYQTLGRQYCGFGRVIFAEQEREQEQERERDEGQERGYQNVKQQLSEPSESSAGLTDRYDADMESSVQESDRVVARNLDRCNRSVALYHQCLTLNTGDGKPVNVSSDTDYSEHSIQILLLLADDVPKLAECPDDLFDLLSLEQVPIKRHWFYRNHWHRWVRFEGAEVCDGKRLVRCVLSYKPGGVSVQSAEPLVFRWSL